MYLLMVVFELRISCAASDHAADFAATTAMLDTDFPMREKLEFLKIVSLEEKEVSGLVVPLIFHHLLTLGNIFLFIKRLGPGLLSASEQQTSLLGPSR